MKRRNIGSIVGIRDLLDISLGLAADRSGRATGDFQASYTLGNLCRLA